MQEVALRAETLFCKETGLLRTGKTMEDEAGSSEQPAGLRCFRPPFRRLTLSLPSLAWRSVVEVWCSLGLVLRSDPLSSGLVPS